MNKDEIIEKASIMFLNLGFKSVTMDDIANDFSISKKTLYLHFKNKEELVKRCTFYIFNKISLEIDAVFNEGKNPIQELFDVKELVLKNLKDEKSSPIYQLQKYYPKIYVSLKKLQFEKIETCMSLNLTRGITQGLYRKNINPFVISRFYFNGMIGIKDTEMFPSLKFLPREVQKCFLEYHLRGICTKDGIKTLEKLLT